jgi:hypothetical protein
MQVAHDRYALDDPLSRQLQDETKHSMRRRMLRPHVEDELLDLALFDLDDRERVVGRVLDSLPLDIGSGYDL